jgi:glycosyltransferase involved in cell wall biosynthesis
LGLKKIVLITTGQPAVNPRIVKEATALHTAGFDVTVLYCFFIDWAADKDKQLLQQVPWKYQRVGGSPASESGLYFFTRLRNKTAALLNRYLGNGFLLAERTQARAYDELLKTAKKIKAGWYIGHNLGALPIAVKAARYNNAKAGFDFEDYHRGELFPSATIDLKRLTYLENKYLPSLNYFSGSSTMITKAVQKDHHGFKGKLITLLNCFPLAQQLPFKEKPEGDETLQLFWFSQTIGLNRGLEQLVDAMQLLNDPSVHLTLAGRCDEAMMQYLEKHAGNVIGNIHFAGILSPDELPLFASKFDVGMALELMIPENRNLCLTNKIFIYLLAGNAIILSSTAMQCAFNQEYKVGEMVHMNDVNTLADKITGYKNKEKLEVQRRYNYALAKEQLNWEIENRKISTLLIQSFR